MSQVCNPVLETPEIKYSIQPGCAFLDPRYYPGTRQAHSGIDLNDVRGGDSDLGNRVRAVADGEVIAAGDYPNWGGIVVLHHPTLGVWTQYAHMIGIRVKVGQKVRMGDVLGHIGKGADGQFWAHLHFEVRRSLLAPDFWASNRFNAKGRPAAQVRQLAENYIREHYHDPEAWLEGHQALRTLEEVNMTRAPKPKPAPKPVDIPALPLPQTPPRRVLVPDGEGGWRNLAGRSFEINGDAVTVRVNAENGLRVEIEGGNLSAAFNLDDALNAWVRFHHRRDS